MSDDALNPRSAMRNAAAAFPGGAACPDSKAPRARGARSFATAAGFTLFEVLVALGVFSIAVTGLAIALDSAVGAAFEARERSQSRMLLESRLAAAMSDPPPNGKRVIEARDNQGVRVEESLEVFEAKTTNGAVVPGLYKLTITADPGKGRSGRETAEILIYKP